MCGRFTIAKKQQEILSAFPYLLLREWYGPRFNVAPSQSVPVILNESPSELNWARWGLLPAWARDESIGSRLFNARAETVATKPAFRDAFRRQRCLILADGFFEWVKIPGTTRRKPYYIQMKDRSIFTFAGLWSRWRDPGGQDRLTSTVITTTPNAVMRPLHDRMPAIVAPEDRAAWLAGGDAAAALLHPFADDALEAHAVSDAVNKAGVDDPSLLLPVRPPVQPELF